MKIVYLESYDINIKPDLPEPYERIIIRAPKPPKIAKVTRFKQVGHRKWSTIYHVRDESSSILFSSEKLSEAVKQAKSLCIKNIKEYYITIGKSLINSDPKVATISPGKHRPGKFKFITLQS